MLSKHNPNKTNMLSLSFQMNFSFKLSRRIPQIKTIYYGSFAFVCVIIVFIIRTTCNSANDKACSNSNKVCFRYNSSSGKEFLLEDVLLSKRKPTPGKTIFFHETSCSELNQLHLTSRQACAIESAALANPSLDVFVLFTSPAHSSNTSKSKIVDAILTYSNVYLRSLNLWTYAADTPISEWLEDGGIFSTKYVKSHISDFLRYLTLYKWGGTYLDLDVVILRSLENIKPNFAGAESDTHVAAGVMNFDNEDFGHEIAAACLRNFQMNFNGNNWGSNGPGVITRVLHDICRTKSPQLMTRNRCTGFKVFPIEAFYAIPWPKWEHFFDPSFTESVLNRTKNSIAVHIWNRHSTGKVINVGSKAAYAEFAEKHCPKVYKASGTYFR